MSGIYIHFPFCKQKCVYCNFYSIASFKDKDAYLMALAKEIALTSSFLPSNNIDTLYFGGGTPSLFSPSELETVVKELQKYYLFSKDFEFTLEANPEQLSSDYLRDLKSIGVNRLSIGVQSFDDEILKLLNRRHDAATAQKAVRDAQTVGFDNVSIDLIYDIAFRTEAMWRTDLQTALSLPVCHLSAYSLTVEENTLLARQISQGKHFVPEESDTERDYAILIEETAMSGFEQYEISNFAKNGRISRHNFSYWTHTPYLGLGPAAHSFCDNVRHWNVANLRQYIDGIAQGTPFVEKEILDKNAQYDEFVLLHLRTCFGVDLNEVLSRFGDRYVSHLEKQLTNVNPAHYQRDGNVLKLTYAGRLFADAVAMELFV